MKEKETQGKVKLKESNNAKGPKIKVRSVLDLKSQNIPEVVVVRRGAGGVLGSWGGGW